MAPTPSSKSKLSTPTTKHNGAHHHHKTPLSKQRINFTKEAAAPPSEHPVEVIGRIRDHPELKNKLNAHPSALQITGDNKSVRVKTEIGYGDFSLDGVSMSEDDDLEGFYKKFVESRINGVKMGQKCTIMMYGPTGSGKSHTMFGCLKQPGIVYNSLKGILGGEEDEEDEEKLGLGTFVQVTVLEIYNEEIYDLLSSAGNGGGAFSLGWSKAGSASKVKLEVMGKKAKNATYISGNEAGKILKEIQKVEKRRIVKSTLCNERSSRSHCMIIVDVPTVGGRLMLVDMAGSENIEQAGQNGLEAKMQTAKINQGNIALKRVVESIANGDSHVPFRDSKLTMLLQDSFEDDKSKILMILCASPDPRELHKTIATLEYGAKAKCIVRGQHTPIKDKGAEDSSSAVMLGSRIAALDQFICKLQIQNRTREKDQKQAQKELSGKEEEVSLLKAKLALAERRGVEASEEEINSKVNERTERLRDELERKIQECEKVANKLVEMERRKMEEKIFQQQQEVEMLRQRLEEIECEFRLSRAGSSSVDMEGGGSFMKKLMHVCSEDSDMVKSMDLDKSLDLETKVIYSADVNGAAAPVSSYPVMNSLVEGMYSFPNKRCLTTVYEEEECENEEVEEVQKEVIEEKQMIENDTTERQGLGLYEDAASSRQLRIQNIFTLCGNYRELSQYNNTPAPARNSSDSTNSMSDPLDTNTEDDASRISNDISPHKTSISKDFVVTDKFDVGEVGDSVELAKNLEDENPVTDCSNIEIYVKWEVSKENQGKQITKLKVSKDSTLADLRKLIEKHLEGDQQAFTFLALGDPSWCPVAKEKEGTTQASKLPICENQVGGGHLACLRPVKAIQQPARQPFSSLENKMATTAISHLTKKVDECFSPDRTAPTQFSTVIRQ